MRQIIICGLVFIVAAGIAQADTFVWKDQKQGFTISFPDSWRVQTPAQGDTALRVAQSPGGQDLAECSVSVQDDGRLDIYPKRLMDEAVVETLNKRYWKSEIARYDNAKITKYISPASLGDKGDATAVRVSFLQNDGKLMQPMQGIMISSIYGGKRYVASCAAKSSAYMRHAEVFASILDSIELDARYHPFPTGYYRNFLAD